jgi:hypothetical protein
MNGLVDNGHDEAISVCVSLTRYGRYAVHGRAL